MLLWKKYTPRVLHTLVYFVTPQQISLMNSNLVFLLFSFYLGHMPTIFKVMDEDGTKFVELMLQW